MSVTRAATRFYIPLVVQSISQSLTYPLVATITTRGEGGVANLAAYAQGQQVLFVLSTIGAGLITTGMVHARTREGYRRFASLNARLMAVILLLQVVCFIPAVGRVLFSNLLGLPAPLDGLASRLFILSLPAQAFFLMRNPYQIALYNARATFKANGATAGRMILTLLISPLFIRLGWVGPYWAVVAFTGPVLLELLISRRMARPYIESLPPAEDKPPSVRDLFAFCMPLSLGGFFLSLSGFMVGAFIARAPDATHMLAIHYIAMGIVNPVSFAALRLQTVVLAFPPVDHRNTRTFGFAMGAGLLLALLPQLVQIPPLYSLYFATVQNLEAPFIPSARLAVLLMSFFPLVQAARGHAEGVAAWARQPQAILAGQAVYLSALVVCLFASLSLGMPGFLMGVTSLIVASLATTGTVRLAVASSFRGPLRQEAEAGPSETRPL